MYFQERTTPAYEDLFQAQASLYGLYTSHYPQRRLSLLTALKPALQCALLSLSTSGLRLYWYSDGPRLGYSPVTHSAAYLPRLPLTGFTGLGPYDAGLTLRLHPCRSSAPTEATSAHWHRAASIGIQLQTQMASPPSGPGARATEPLWSDGTSARPRHPRAVAVNGRSSPLLGGLQVPTAETTRLCRH